MIKEITICNFKSLADITLDLTSYTTKQKHLAVIFGENGSGKSNLIEAIRMLKGTVMAENLFGELYKWNHRIGTDEPIGIQMVLALDGKLYDYYLSFDDKGVYEEWLSELNKATSSRTYFFNRRDSLLVEEELSEKMKEEIEEYENQSDRMFSFLTSILEYYLWNENKEGFEIDAGLKNVLDFFNYTFNPQDEWEHDLMPESVFRVDSTYYLLNKETMRKYTVFLSRYMSALCPDIKSVIYKEEDLIYKKEYVLYFIRQIDDSEIEVRFSEESEGVKQLVGLFAVLLEAIDGKVMVLDDYFKDVHPILLKKILRSAEPYIKGQLIMPSNQTSLFDALPTQNIYLLDINTERYKDLFSVDLVQDNEQLDPLNRTNYENGLLGGAWFPNGFQFYDYYFRRNKKD